MKNSKYSFHDGDILEVDREYEQLLINHNKSWLKKKLVRKFTNGHPLLDSETAKKLDRREMTNMMTFYHMLMGVVTSYKAQVNSTDDLVNIIVDTNNPNKDRETGVILSEAVNRGLIYRKDKFKRLWHNICDEVVISGGAFLVHDKSSGYIPNIEQRMIFPDNADLDVENLSYAFRPVQLTIKQLVSYRNKAEENGNKNVKAIDSLIEQIKEQVKKEGLSNISSINNLQNDRGSVRNEHDLSYEVNKNTINAYWFYEVIINKDDTPHVSATLIARNEENPLLEGGLKRAVELIHSEKAFETLEDWITFIVVDSEIGGEGKINSLRGIAEMIYPAALKKEQLLNLMLEGDEIRALPKFILDDDTSVETIQQLDIRNQTFFPKVSELRMNSSSNHLMTPMALLDGIGASFSSGASSPRTSEKLPEAKQRVADQSVVKISRRDEMENNLQMLVENVVYRALTCKVKAGDEGYMQIMWFRDFLERNGVDYKELSKRKYGRFVYMEVKVRKVLGSSGLDEQQGIAKYFNDSVSVRPPQQRANILYEMDLMITGDPDRARLYSGKTDETDRIMVAQKTIAGQEWNDISNMAVFEQSETPPINDSDVAQDHVPQHLRDTESAVMMGKYEDYTEIKVRAITMMMEHINFHLQQLSASESTRAEADAYAPRINNLINTFSQILTEQQRNQEQQQGDQPSKEMIEMEIKMEKQRLERDKFEYKSQVEMPELFGNRQSREERANRAQDFKESATAAQLRILNNQINNK